MVGRDGALIDTRIVDGRDPVGNKVAFAGKKPGGRGQDRILASCSEAWQKPEFAEWVLVLRGMLHLEHADGITQVPAGSGVFLAANLRAGFHSRWMPSGG